MHVYCLCLVRASTWRAAAHRHTCIDASSNYRAVETSRILLDFPFSDFVTPSTCFKQLAVCDMCTMGVLMSECVMVSVTHVDEDLPWLHQAV